MKFPGTISFRSTIKQLFKTIISGKNPFTLGSWVGDKVKQQFYLSVEYSDARPAVAIISESLEGIESVLKNKSEPVKVIVDSIKGNKVRIHTVFFIHLGRIKGSPSAVKFNVMLKTLQQLTQAGIRFSV